MRGGRTVTSTEALPYASAPPGGQPPYLHAEYGSTVKRAPLRKPIRLDHTLSEVTGPSFADGWAGPNAVDLTRQHKGEPLGERVIVAGRVRDRGCRPGANYPLAPLRCQSARPHIHTRAPPKSPLPPHFH